MSISILAARVSSAASLRYRRFPIGPPSYFRRTIALAEQSAGPWFEIEDENEDEDENEQEHEDENETKLHKA